MMKKLLSILLSMTLLLTLAACGKSDAAPDAPDLNRFYEDYMASLGEENTPAMMDVDADLLPQIYPGLQNISLKQAVLKTAMISSVAYEFALVELEDASKVQEAAGIFQDRIDYQIEAGAFYPSTVEAWEKAEVITHGNVAALICAWDDQDRAVEEFNSLFA